MQAFYNFLVVDPNNTFLRAVLLALISAFVAVAFVSRGRLRWYQVGQYVYSMPPAPALADAEPNAQVTPNLMVHTKQIWFYNDGRAPVENVEIVLNYKPQHYEVWPPRAIGTRELGNARESLLVENLAPREGFMLAVLEARPGVALADVISVRSKTNPGKQVPMQLARKFPNWVVILRAALLLFGVGSAAQYLFIFLAKLVAIYSSAPP